MRRALDRLASLRLTLGLIVALSALFVAGLAIPQKRVLQRPLYEQWRSSNPGVVAALETLGLTDVYRSPIAYALWGAFFVNLAVVMARRVPATVRRVRLQGDIAWPEPSAFAVTRELPAEADPLPSARAFFLQRGYHVQVAEDRLRAVKHRFAPLATLAFHLSFFVVAAGAVLSVITRFEGEVDLGVGERFTGALEQYVRPPSLPAWGAPPSTEFLLLAVEPEVVGDVPTAIRIHVLDRLGFKRTFGINDPYHADGATFVFRNLGVAPLLVLLDPEGSERFGGFMRLNVLQGRSESFTLDGYRIVARLIPDFGGGAGPSGARSQEMRDPVFDFAVEDPGGGMTRGLLRPGDTLALGGHVLALGEWRYWVRLYVRAEEGIGLLWFGLIAGSLAVALRLLRYRREYVVGWTGGGQGSRLVVGGRAEYYRALFLDEANRVLDELQARLVPGGPGPGEEG